MRKLKIAWLFAIFLFFTVFSVNVSAEEYDDSRRGTLTMHYTVEGLEFPWIEVQAYRIAEMNSYGSFQLRSPYSGYPVNIYNVTTQQQWKDIATTFVGYIQADDIPPNTLIVTNENGIAHMNNMRAGLYLIPGTTIEMDGVSYIFDNYWVYMPMRNEDGTWNYDVEVKPKCSVTVLPDVYTVKIIWLDAGYEDIRPASTNVEIYHAGVLQETVKMSDQNDWFYKWEVPGNVSNRALLRALPVTETGWSVVQTEIPDRYDVTVNLQGHDFTIINVYKEQGGDKPGAPDEPDSPDKPDKPEIYEPSDDLSSILSGGAEIKTGDAANMDVYIMLLVIAGIGLLIIGFYRSRKNEKEKD